MSLSSIPRLHRVPWALCCALAMSCGALDASATPPAEVIMKTSGEKTPHPELAFVDGPQLTDSTAFGAWFSETAARTPSTRVRLPVVIEVSRTLDIGVKAAFVGVSSKAGGYAVELTDRMGIPLSDHLRIHCPEDARYCGLWLEGYPATADRTLPLPGEKASGPIFDVVRVVAGFVDGALPASTVGRLVAP